LDALVRNVARGMADVSLFHIGQVVLPHADPVPIPDVASTRARPTSRSGR